MQCSEKYVKIIAIYRDIFEYHDISKFSVFFFDDTIRYINIENDILIFSIYRIITSVHRVT